MLPRIITDYWEATLPDGWGSNVDEVCWAAFDPAGIGVLQFSGAIKAQAVTKEDLREFAAKHLQAGARIRNLRCGDYTGFTLTYRDEETHTQEWYLRCAHHVLFVTYNCAPLNCGVHKEHVRCILDSLRYKETTSD